MTASDFNKQKQFAAALTNATEQAFNVTRFAGIVFGFTISDYQTPPIASSARIFQHMMPGAATFANSLAQFTTFNCGGTPTDEAISFFASELTATQVPGRLQMAVLSTDGIPTLCYTTTQRCHGTNASSDTIAATNAAIAQRLGPFAAEGSLMMTVGIGGSLGVHTGTTTNGIDYTGQQLLQYFASSPRLALLATNLVR